MSPSEEVKPAALGGETELPRKRGRPKKVVTEDVVHKSEPPRKRGRPKKAVTESAAEET